MIQWNKFGLIRSYNLKDMNFLIFIDFFRFFLNFSEFKIDLLELNSLKNIFLSLANVARAEKWCHVATCETATCHTHVFMRVCVCD